MVILKQACSENREYMLLEIEILLVASFQLANNKLQFVTIDAQPFFSLGAVTEVQTGFNLSKCCFLDLPSP